MSQNISTAVMQRRAEPDDSLTYEQQRSRSPERRAYGRHMRQKHIEKRRAYDRQRYLDPDRRAWQKKQAADWGRQNKGKRAAIIAARRAALKQATPPWLTAEHKLQIRAFYLEAAAREGEWHVDHIYPLKGKNSCGLHVPWNLQLLPGDDNRRKGNRIDGAE